MRQHKKETATMQTLPAEMVEPGLEDPVEPLVQAVMYALTQAGDVAEAAENWRFRLEEAARELALAKLRVGPDNPLLRGIDSIRADVKRAQRQLGRVLATLGRLLDDFDKSRRASTR